MSVKKITRVVGVVPLLLFLLLCVSAAAPVVAEYREIALTEPGVIEGQVLVSGNVSPLPPKPVHKQRKFCGNEVPDDRLIVGKNGELQNAIVYLNDIKSGTTTKLEQPVKLDNRECRFVPHVLTATLGQTLEIQNSDPFLHDAHAWLGSRSLFNSAVLSGRTVRKPLLDVGLIHINCDIRHTWMHAYLFVAEHPYHTVTDSAGKFRLDDVPPGTWTLRVWHELLGSVDRSVRLDRKETKSVKITLRADGEEKP